MRWLRKKWIVVALLISLIMPMVSSYSVEPAKWEVYMYKDYEITPQTKLSIYIDNTNNASISIKLSVTSLLSLKAGYEPLPSDNFSWIQFKETDITIPPHTKYSIPIIIDVPNETANYNKSWQFYIFVDQYAGGDSNGTAVFQYDYYLVWTIKTPPRYVPMNERTNKSPVEKTLPLFFIVVIMVMCVAIWYMHSRKGVMKGKSKNEKRKSSENRNNPSDFIKR